MRSSLHINLAGLLDQMNFVDDALAVLHAFLDASDPILSLTGGMDEFTAGLTCTALTSLEGADHSFSTLDPADRVNLFPTIGTASENLAITMPDGLFLCVPREFKGEQELCVSCGCDFRDIHGPLRTVDFRWGTDANLKKWVCSTFE